MFSVSVEEELHEHAEHARAPFDKRVAATMAVIAAGLAVVSVLGQLAATEELLSQERASDQWAYYQAKTIRRYESEIARDAMEALKSDKAAVYAANVDRYQKESEEIQKQAKELETESSLKGREALRLHFGEILLEIAIIFASLAILTKRPIFYWIAVTGSALGIVIALTELAVH